MNSDKAADVRDAINSLPCVAYDPEVSPNYPSGGNSTIRWRGKEWTHTGECVRTEKYSFSPARINEAGQIAFGEDAPMRPCYEVILQPLTIPTRPLPTITIPPSVVHEVAKYNCRLRVASGLRGEWTPGTIHVRDDLAYKEIPDGIDQCGSCGCTRFQLRDGLPTCERCGETHESAIELQERELTIEDFE